LRNVCATRWFGKLCPLLFCQTPPPERWLSFTSSTHPPATTKKSSKKWYFRAYYILIVNPFFDMVNNRLIVNLHGLMVNNFFQIVKSVGNYVDNLQQGNSDYQLLVLLHHAILYITSHSIHNYIIYNHILYFTFHISFYLHSFHYPIT
jgi:hypothetical protein